MYGFHFLQNKQPETAVFATGAATWRTGRNIRADFDSGPFASLCDNLASSTIPEVHNVLHYGQRRPEPRRTTDR